MPNTRTAILTTLAIGLLLANTLWPSQPGSMVKIDFEKSPKVRIGESTWIKVTVEALDEVEDVDVDISLPEQTTLLRGNTEHEKDLMAKGERLTLPLQISLDDAVMDRMSVEVESEKNDAEFEDISDLYFVSYAGQVEILTQEEASDQTHRYWKAYHSVPEGVPVVPITYEDSFIQLEPGEEDIEESVHYEVDDDNPFGEKEDGDEDEGPDGHSDKEDDGKGGTGGTLAR